MKTEKIGQNKIHVYFPKFDHVVFHLDKDEKCELEKVCLYSTIRKIYFR